MTDQTGRIKQMAQEAGFGIGHSEAAATLFAKFAALVAEDCLRVLGDEADKAMDRGLGNDVYHLATWTDEAIRARYAIAKPPEAG